MSTLRRAGPSPLLVPTLAAVVVIVLTTSLGAWQLGRADEKRALQAAREAAALAEPVRIGARPVVAADLAGRPVVAQGRWLNERSVFLDNRTHQGRAGFHVLTPLRLDDAGADAAPVHLLVLRGWVPGDPRERTRLPELPGGAQVARVEGVAQADLPGAMSLSSGPGEGEGGRIWQRLDLAGYAAWSGLALQPVIVRQTGGDSDSLVRDWPVPGAGVDKHLGYALQWFAMAVATAALWGWFGLRPALVRRAGRDEATDAAGAAGADRTNGPNDG